MTQDHLYETETMAELCARQGRLGEAVAIYRSLAQSAADPATRSRAFARLQKLEATWQPLRETELPPTDLPLPTEPGVVVRSDDDQIAVAWALPADASPLALDILVLQKTEAGIEVQKRLLPLQEATGRLGFAVPSIHSVVAAAGTMRDGHFIALARSQ